MRQACFAQGASRVASLFKWFFLHLEKKIQISTQPFTPHFTKNHQVGVFTACKFTGACMDWTVDAGHDASCVEGLAIRTQQIGCEFMHSCFVARCFKFMVEVVFIACVPWFVTKLHSPHKTQGETCFHRRFVTSKYMGRRNVRNQPKPKPIPNSKVFQQATHVGAVVVYCEKAESFFRNAARSLSKGVDPSWEAESLRPNEKALSSDQTEQRGPVTRRRSRSSNPAPQALEPLIFFSPHRLKRAECQQHAHIQTHTHTQLQVSCLRTTEVEQLHFYHAAVT